MIAGLRRRIEGLLSRRGWRGKGVIWEPEEESSGKMRMKRFYLVLLWSELYGVQPVAVICL